MGWKERCPEAETLLQFSEETLRGRRRRACAKHVRTCPRCREELAVAGRLSGLLSRFSPPQTSPDLAARLLQALPEAEPLAPLTCRQARNLISPCLDNEATPQQEERLWAHLFLCGSCLRRFRETERLAAISGRHEPVQIPAHLLRRVLAAVAESAAQPRRRPALRLAPAGLAAVGSAVALLTGLLLLRSPARPPTAEVRPPTSVAEAGSSVPAGPPARLAETLAAGRPEAGRPTPTAAPEGRRPSSAAARAIVAPPAPGLAPPPSTPPVRVGPASAPMPMPFVSPAEPRAVPAPAYTPPAPRTPEPVPLPARPPSPAPPAAPPVAVAAAPSHPAVAPPPAAPAERESPPPRALVVSSEPEAVRQLRWTPSQSSEVVVIRRTGHDGESALAEVNEALNEYGRQLRRTQPRALVVVR